MTSPLDGIIPTTINISLEKREPPAPPPPPVPLVLDQHDNHYVVEGEGALGVATRAAEVQQPVQAPAAQVPPVQAPPAPAPAYVPTPVAPAAVVEPRPAPAQHFAEPMRPAVPPPAPSPVVATPVQDYYAPPQQAPQATFEAPAAPASVPAPPATWPPADAMEGFDVEPDIASGPVFTQHQSSIRPVHVFAVLGVLIVGAMAVISYLWISEKFFNAPASQMAAKTAAQPAAAEQLPAQQQTPKEAEILEQSLPEPVVIASAPASAAVPPAPAPAPAPAPKTVAPPPAPKAVEPAKPAPAAAAPVRAQVQPPAAPPVVQPKPEPRVTAAVQQPSHEPSTSDRQNAGGRGWAMRVERNGVLFFVDGKANLYRVGDSLPNGERLVDVDESSATYATDRGVRQVRSSPLQQSK